MGRRSIVPAQLLSLGKLLADMLIEGLMAKAATGIYWKVIVCITEISIDEE